MRAVQAVHAVRVVRTVHAVRAGALVHLPSAWPARGAASASRVPPPASLRRLFDAPETTARVDRTRPATGLFGYDEFTGPDALPGMVARMEARVLAIVDRMTAPGRVRGVATVDALDELSDEVCKVFDLAEMVRNVHPDPRMVEAAEAATTAIGSTISELNTHPGLYQASIPPLCSRVRAPIDTRRWWRGTRC